MTVAKEMFPKGGLRWLILSFFLLEQKHSSIIVNKIFEMELAIEQLIVGEPVFCPPLALHFHKNTLELSNCDPHFHKRKEYI